MNRRGFLNCMAVTAAGPFLPSQGSRSTKHVIFIVNGGARKKDYYENASIARNVRRLASEGFVFEEDHCSQIASHDAAFAELLGGASYPTIGSLRLIPSTMERHRPRILICRETAHDVGHRSFEAYLSSVKAADEEVGQVFDWVKSHPDFSQNTAIVIRPEFGRDDEVNAQGALHHSYGFYYTHRVASIFWGPNFNKGVDRKTVVRAADMAPRIAGILGD
jgi:hypothetical protein